VRTSLLGEGKRREKGIQARPTMKGNEGLEGGSSGRPKGLEYLKNTQRDIKGNP